MVDQSGFDAFVREHWSMLMSIGVAVSGSRVEAEYLVQIALVGAYRRWSRIRPDQAVAYVRKSIVNAQISRWRRHRGAELSVAEPPERRQPDAVDSVRTQARRALATLRARHMSQPPAALATASYRKDLP